MPHLFDPLTLRGVTFKNRIMMAPCTTYRAGPDALPTDWHYLHYPTRAVGGVGLIMVEATAVESCGRIDDRHLGIYEDRHTEPLARLVSLCHANGAKIGLQIVHGGRKSWRDVKGFGPEEIVAPSALAFDEVSRVPRALTIPEIDQIVGLFQSAARRAREAGFDVLEIHGAHGYLISSFLSPISNHRTDEYGGSLENRLRLLRRVVDAVRGVWPECAPLFVRVSATDYVPGGHDLAETIQVARVLREQGVDLLDCSSGSIVPVPIPVGPGYQVTFAQDIKRESGLCTAAVGMITTPEMAEEIIRNQRADLVALGRELLRHPYWPLDAAAALGVDLEWPAPYRRAKRAPLTSLPPIPSSVPPSQR